MKKPFTALALLMLVGGLLWILIPKQNVPVEEPVTQDRPLPKPPTRLRMTNLPRVEPLLPWQADGITPKAIPENMRRATEDPAVAELFANFKWIEVGKIEKTEGGNQQLWDGTRLVFEAKRISERRSKSADGTIALSAVTGDQTPIEDAEVIGTGDDAKLSSSPREIWIVTPSGNKAKVSPPNMDAFAPLIEPNGIAIAFTGRLLNNKGFPSSQRLYVGDLTSGHYRAFAGDEHLHDYRVWAVDWVEDNSVLRVLQDHGETGGHMKLKQIRVR